MHYVFFALYAHFAGFFYGCFAAVVHIIFIFYHLGTDKAAFEVAVNNACTLWRFAALLVGPCTHFIGSGGEEGLKIEQRISCLDEAANARLGEAHFFEEHLTLFVGVELGNFRFGLGCHHQYLGILFLHGFANSFHIFVAAHCACLIHVAHIKHGLVGEQK